MRLSERPTAIIVKRPIVTYECVAKKPSAPARIRGRATAVIKQCRQCAENRSARGTMIRGLRLESDAAPFSVERPDLMLESTVATMLESPRGYCAAGQHLLGGKLGKASGDASYGKCGISKTFNKTDQRRALGL